jgi:RNA polymerase sigma-70 factor (ECF subfamily)
MDKRNLCDEALMMLVKERQDSEAFDLLYQRYFQRLLTFVQALAWNSSEAEDITQWTFQRIIEKRDTFDGSRGNFKAWLFRIASNKVSSWQRWSNRLEHFVQTYAHGLPESFDPLMEAGLGDMLDLLNESERAVALLRVDGFTELEIACSLKCSVSTVERRLVSIRRKLGELPRGATYPKS